MEPPLDRHCRHIVHRCRLQQLRAPCNDDHEHRLTNNDYHTVCGRVLAPEHRCRADLDWDGPAVDLDLGVG